MNISAVRSGFEEIPYSDPVKLFTKYSQTYYSSLLTGRGPDDISNYSFIGLSPHTIIRYKESFFEIETANGIKRIDTGFWEYLNFIYSSMNFHELPYPANMCGAMGYLSYEGLHTIEKIESTTIESYSMPVFELVLYNSYILFDHHQMRCFWIKINIKHRAYWKEFQFLMKIRLLLLILCRNARGVNMLKR